MLFSSWLKRFKGYSERDLRSIYLDDAIELENKYIEEFYSYCKEMNASMCLNDLDRYYLID